MIGSKEPPLTDHQRHYDDMKEQFMIIDKLTAILGIKNIITDKQDMSPFLEDWRGNHKGDAHAILLPTSTQMVSDVMRLADEEEENRKAAKAKQKSRTKRDDDEESDDDDLETEDELEDEFDEEELQSVLKSELDDARDFIDQLGDERAESTEYYLGNSPEGGSDIQSEYVSTDVRDAVLHIMPSLMRTFFGTSKVVEFVPKNQEDIPAAQQQTDYVNYIFSQKNPGFNILYSVFKDALIRKAGFVKAFYDSSIDTTTHEYKNLSVEQYVAIMTDEDIEVLEENPIMESRTIVNEDGNKDSEEVVVAYNLKVRKVKSSEKVCIEAVPPEEILISRNSRSLHDSPYVAHRMIVSVSDLVAMGYDKEEVEQYANYGNDATNEDERKARNPLHEINDPDRTDVSGQQILYIEHYVRYDKDQDGINELLKVCTIGTA